MATPTQNELKNELEIMLKLLAGIDFNLKLVDTGNRRSCLCLN
jgi:hypothetical protein